MFLPEFLWRTIDVIINAFPDEVNDDELRCIMVIMDQEEYSDRNIAEILSIALGKDYSLLFHEVIRAKYFWSESLEDVRTKLNNVGFSEMVKDLE